MGAAWRYLDVALGLWLMSGTALSLSRHPHWYIRGWDFPRIAIAGLAVLCGIPYALYVFQGQARDYAFLGGLLAVVLWQMSRVWRYLPFARETVKRSDAPRDGGRVRIVISNVLMENSDHEGWLRVVRAARPDVIHAVEVDDAWDQALRVLEPDYPHVLRHPLDNYYGMVLYSRFPIHDPQVRYLVQKDIPSIHAEIELPCQERFSLHGLHPRPPEPLRNQDSAPRDAELVVMGRKIGEEERGRPTVVTGDLNDVAWSYTTQLFLRLSGLLDPRMGRGLYNSYNANNPFFRFPLDHVFHSNEWKLVALERLDKVGSDHFPMLIELSLEPEAVHEQEEPVPDQDDHEQAQEIVETQEEREREGEEAP